ncbi:MAG: cation:proton antiporter [Desulfobacterales bacterium]|nr:cation:proton antiporter [Desulfobacterales bacterium]
MKKFQKSWLFLTVTASILLVSSAGASEAQSGVSRSFVYLLFELSLVLTAAKLGGWIARVIGLPVVLGELFAGMLLGNMTLLGVNFFEQISRDPSLATLAELGVILLMFEVGVESTVPELMRVGKAALLVALIGVVAPFTLGFGTVRLFFPALSLWVDIFLGATLCATSVGISARVLKDLDYIRQPEGKTILGAAVVDDVLGLIILAVVVALIGTSTAPPAGAPSLAIQIGVIVLKAFGFLIVGTVLGVLFSKRIYRWAAGLHLRGMLLTLSLTLCFAFAYLAHEAGLAPIIGAFAAGLILEPQHSEFFFEQERESLEHLLIPLSTIFVPIFFFHIGMQVDFSVLLSSRAVLVGAVLSAVAVLGKMLCIAGLLFGRREADPWAVAIGMIPRGEVGLIFAGLGVGLKVNGAPLLDATLYAAIIAMVFVTTAIAPSLLEWRLRRIKQKRAPMPGKPPMSQ